METRMPGAALGGRPNYLVKSVIYDCRYDDQVRCTRQVCRTIPKCPTEARGIILQARKLPEAVVGTVPLAATLGGLCLACRGAAPPCLAGNRALEISQSPVQLVDTTNVQPSVK